MDFEEQLEKAERLDTPSLVGASMRSADDSPHNNYIHPEKYKARGKKKATPSLMNSHLGASLDDLMSEGALLGSEEDFEKFLDEGGHVKDDARYLETAKEAKGAKEAKEATLGKMLKEERAAGREHSSPLKHEVTADESRDASGASQGSPVSEILASVAALSTKPAESDSPAADSGSGLYSTPNLSEYQLEHLIRDHSEMLANVKSHNLDRLPGYRAETKNAQFLRDAKKPAALPTGSTFSDSMSFNTGPADGLHTPYFQQDSRSRSRSLNRTRIADRSRSRSAVKPHLARGDSYKNIHDDEPSKYELPPDLDPAEEETDGDRRSRQSKPTLGDSIAAAEAARQQQQFHEDAAAASKASLLTTGDYTNFNVDVPERSYHSGRSASATNYLRTISRSRLRQPDSNRHSQLTEKNDADIDGLISEGALVTDDPYMSIDHLDTMMEEVWTKKNDKEGTQLDTSTKEAKETTLPRAVSTTEDKKHDENETSVNSSEQLKVEKEAEKKGTMSQQKFDVEDTKKDKVATQVTETEEAKEEDDTETEPLNVASKPADAKHEDEVEAETANEDGVQEDDKPAKAADADIGDELLDAEVTDKVDEVLADKVSAEPVEDKGAVEIPTEKPEGEGATTLGISGSEVPKPSLESNQQADNALAEMLSEPVATAVLEKDTDKSVEEDSTKEDVHDKEPETKTLITDYEEPMDTDTEPEPKEPAHAEVQDIGETLISQPGESFGEETKAEVEEASEKSEKNPKKELADGSDAEEKVATKEELEPKVEVKKDAFAETKVAAESEKEVSNDELEEQPSKDVAKEANDKVSAKEVSAEGEVPGETKETTEETAVGKTLAADDDEDFDVSPEELRKHLEAQPVYVFTSFAGGMQIVHRTNRLATILKGNGIEFTQRDLGTDDEAKKIWRRYSAGRTLPGVVRGDDFIGNWEEIDEANEDYQVRALVYETL